MRTRNERAREPARRRKSPSATESSEPDASLEEGRVDSPGLEDPLLGRCRHHPEVLDWYTTLHRLVRYEGTLVVLSRRFLLMPLRSREQCAQQLLRCLRAIEIELSSTARLDDRVLSAVQVRVERQHSTLGGLCGMDAALNVGRWIVSGGMQLRDAGVPPSFRWNYERTQCFSGLKPLDSSAVAAWIAEQLDPQLINQVYAAR